MISENKRTALVTGGIGGLGTAIAQSLADRGHQVLVAYYVEDNPEKWLAEQKEQGYNFKLILLMLLTLTHAKKWLSRSMQMASKLIC